MKVINLNRRVEERQITFISNFFTRQKVLYFCSSATQGDAQQLVSDMENDGGFMNNVNEVNSSSKRSRMLMRSASVLFVVVVRLLNLIAHLQAASRTF
jgi:hypothetical protein